MKVDAMAVWNDAMESGRRFLAPPSPAAHPVADRRLAKAMAAEEQAGLGFAFKARAIAVVIVAICAAIGAVWRGGPSIILAPVTAILGWLLWSAVAYLIGDKLLGGTATWGELLRTVGFAQSPGVLMIFGIIPLLGGIVRAVVGLWLLVAGIVAIRQALDFSTGKAIITAFLGWLAMVLLAFLSGGGAWFKM